MSGQHRVEQMLDVLSSWSDGFVLGFVFSDEACPADLDADTVYCAGYVGTFGLVDAVLARLAEARRAVVLNFENCPVPLIQDAVRRLNERRSLLEQVPFPVVVLCPISTRMLVQYAAPDLWHIRTIVPDIPAEN